MLKKTEGGGFRRAKISQNFLACNACKKNFLKITRYPTFKRAIFIKTYKRFVLTELPSSWNMSHSLYFLTTHNVPTGDV